MFNNNKRKKYTFSGNGQRSSEPPPGPRQVLLPGGTGEAVGREILADEALMALDTLRVGFIDSDQGAIGDLGKEQAYSLAPIPAQELVEALQQNPSVFPGAELLGPPDKLWGNLGPSDDINAGSPYGERKWGLVALWYHVVRYFLPLMIFLMGLIRDLNKYAETANEMISKNGLPRTMRQMRIICSVIFSVCGGTGSAIALYLVDLFNYLLRTLWGIHLVEFEAHLVLPGVFLAKAEDPQSLLAKAQATCKELVARYGRPFAPVQLGHLLISRTRKPFTKMYLYDVINQEGSMVDSRRQLAQVIKWVWQTINFGPMAGVYRGLLERVRSEYPRVFSAAGVYIKEFPVERIIQQLGYHLAAEFVEEHFLYTWPEAEARQAAQRVLADWLNRLPAVRELPAFRLDQKNKPIRVNIAERFKALPRKLIPQAVETYMLQTLAGWHADLKQQALAQAKQQAEVIAQELAVVLNSGGGFDLARYVLVAVDAYLEGKEQEVTRAIEREREQLTHLQQTLPANNQGNRRRWSFNPRREYLQRHETAMASQVDYLRLEAKLAYTHHLRSQVKSYLTMVAGWRNTLAELSARLATAEAEFVRQQQAQQAVVVETVVTPEEIDWFYSEGKTTAFMMIEQGVTVQWLPDEAKFVLEYASTGRSSRNDGWSVLSQEGIARHVGYCQQAWEGLRELSLEQILSDRGEDPLTIATELEQKAIPWVAVSEVKQIPAEQKLLLLGTEKGETGFWQGYAAKLGHLNFVPTGDKTRMVFLYTVHGLDVFNLRQAVAWEQAYAQAIKAGKPLHVVPELDPLANETTAQPMAAAVEEEARQSADKAAPEVTEEQIMAVQ